MRLTYADIFFEAVNCVEDFSQGRSDDHLFLGLCDSLREYLSSSFLKKENLEEHKINLMLILFEDCYEYKYGHELRDMEVPALLEEEIKDSDYHKLKIIGLLVDLIQRRNDDLELKLIQNLYAYKVSLQR